MIEEKLERMAEGMESLSAAINRVCVLLQAQPARPETVSQKAETVSQKAETVSQKAETVSQTPKTPTLKELQDFCLELVRKNPKAKTKISKTVKSFGGDLIKDVPEEKYPELKTALEAIDAA
jgi:hypothetical protein